MRNSVTTSPNIMVAVKNVPQGQSDAFEDGGTKKGRKGKRVITRAPSKHSILSDLLAPLESIGPKTQKLINELCGPSALDVLLHMPIGTIDRRSTHSISNSSQGERVTVEARVLRHIPSPYGSPKPHRVICHDGEREFDVVYFRAHPNQLMRILPTGRDVLISGRVNVFKDRFSIQQPDLVRSCEDGAPEFEAVYRLTNGLPAAVLRKAIDEALNRLPFLPEWIPGHRIASEQWEPWILAMEDAHRPNSEDSVQLQTASRRRLAYDELLAQQLRLGMLRCGTRQRVGGTLNPNGSLQKRALSALPFELTKAQSRTLAEIESDLRRPSPMLRLVQGDVGSGKTAVALIAMLMVIECGRQACLMAPTEILARQHHASMQPVIDQLGLQTVLLTGREQGKARAAALESIRSGQAQVVIGTHALFEDLVAFNDLGLAVVDEQHRFGVEQRLRLSTKGGGTDVLMMTATPIPRTLTMTAYGDMSLSILDELPPGRKPIETSVISASRIPNLVDGIRRKIEAQERVYWICPLVEESEVSDLKAAEARAFELREALGENKVGLVHGKMAGAEKDAAMADFASGKTSVLVATTVVEVGVNVPEATVIVVEHAERFGLSQLHQLRGRVGRGSLAASCILLYGDKVSDDGKARLMIMRSTQDGFRISEEDLRIRGPGEVLGHKQSGAPEWRVADFSAHQDLVTMAREDATAILLDDPLLTNPENSALQILLEIFPGQHSEAALATA